MSSRMFCRSRLHSNHDGAIALFISGGDPASPSGGREGGLVPNRMAKVNGRTLFLLSSILDSSRLTAIRGTAKTVSLSRYAAHVKGLQVGPGSSVSRSESCRWTRVHFVLCGVEAHP